jgi:hypothetical protein
LTARCVREGIITSSTAEKIEQLYLKNILPLEIAALLTEYFEFCVALRIRAHLFYGEEKDTVYCRRKGGVGAGANEAVRKSNCLFVLSEYSQIQLNVYLRILFPFIHDEFVLFATKQESKNALRKSGSDGRMLIARYDTRELLWYYNGEQKSNKDALNTERLYMKKILTRELKFLIECPNGKYFSKDSTAVAQIDFLVYLVLTLKSKLPLKSEEKVRNQIFRLFCMIPRMHYRKVVVEKFREDESFYEIFKSLFSLLNTLPDPLGERICDVEEYVAWNESMMELTDEFPSMSSATSGKVMSVSWIDAKSGVVKRVLKESYFLQWIDQKSGYFRESLRDVLPGHRIVVPGTNFSLCH